MDSFKDKIAIVTGGGSGIGAALCEELGRNGAVVVAADINLGGAQNVAACVAENGGRASAVQLDVTQADAVRQLVTDTAAEHGRLDLMFNNAGIAVGGEFLDMNLDHWRRVVDVDLWGVVNGSIVAYSLMAKQGFGHIVNTSSLAGLIPCPMNTPYCASKFGVVGFTKSIRREGAAFGVKASVVCPGVVQTPILDNSPILNIDREKLEAKLKGKVRTVDPADAARVILRGVACNRAIIIFPFPARFLWWLYRLHPSLSAVFENMLIREIRAVRIEPEG